MKKAILAIILILCAVVALSGCTTVTEIALVENGVKTEYSVDEEFPREARISVKYKNGKTETVNIRASDVEGFDTGISGTRTMTVNYGGKSLPVEYNVKGRVNTRARVKADVDVGDGVLKITLSLSGLDTSGAPLYAIKIKTAYSADKLEYVGAVAAADGWTVETVATAGSVSALFYNADAENPINADCKFAEITFGTLSQADGTEFYFSGGSAGYEEIDVSDGEGIWYMPAFGIGYYVIED